MKVLPNPQKSENISGSFTVDADTKIYADAAFTAQAERFANLVFESTDFRLQFTDVIEEAHIIFNLGEQLADEAYVVMIAQGVATITSSSQSGCFYGVETLRQIFNLDVKQQTIECANCYIEDSPKFTHRGLMIDVCRHFFDVDTLKTVIDLMSSVKLNKLHLHLSDDQGFRLQIDKYPLLTEVGSVRNGTEVVKDGKRYVDEQPYGGYYTKQDMRDLIAYASEHSVEIIPEIELPGHFVAALSAYPEFSCTGQVSEVRKSWGMSKDVLCAGNDNTYAFVCDILDEVCQLFPSSYIHLGGGEIPTDRWCNCKLCRERMSELQLNDYDELHNYMIEYFRKYLETNGKTVICWNDGLTKDSSNQIVSQVWKQLSRKHGVRQTQSGRKVILSPHFASFFGWPYSAVPLNKTLMYNPLKSIDYGVQENVLGVEGVLWTEYVDSNEKLFFQLLPRIDALAECAWSQRKVNFVKRIKKRLDLYDKLGLTCNKDALIRRVAGRLATTKRFFRKDSDIELNKSKKSLN